MGCMTSGWSPENDTVSYVAYEQKGIRIQGDMVSIRLRTMRRKTTDTGRAEPEAASAFWPWATLTAAGLWMRTIRRSF